MARAARASNPRSASTPASHRALITAATTVTQVID
jgi:hypothetical protein